MSAIGLRLRPRRPLLLAHRGHHRRAAENTLAAFEAAAAMPGCDGVELDVRLSADGEAIVLHDATLSRVHRRSGAARDLTAAQLASFGVPRLADVLATLPATFFVDVELKEPAIDAVAVALAAARSPQQGTIVVSSFDAAILESFAVVAPQWPRWLIADDGQPAFSIARDMGCWGLALAVPAIEARIVAECHVVGLSLMAWTVRDRRMRSRLASLGVDAICAEGSALEG